MDPSNRQIFSDSQSIQSFEGLNLNPANQKKPEDVDLKSQAAGPLLKKNCLEIINANKSNFVKLSKSLWGEITGQNQKIREQISSFQTMHKDKIALLQKYSWKELIDRLHDDMATNREAIVLDGIRYDLGGMSMEEFRQAAKQFQETLSEQAGHLMGIEKGKWAASGTSGFKSDIDNVFLVSNSQTEMDQMLVKILADSVWSFTFEGLSGTQAELETYLNHPGAARDTASRLTTDLGRQEFVKIELNMSILEMRRAIGHDKKEWENYKKNLLEKFGHLSEARSSLSEMFIEVELFEKHMNDGIIKQMIMEHYPELSHNIDQMSAASLQALARNIVKSDGDAIKNAAISYKAARLIEISKQMDRNYQDLNKCLKQLEKLDQTFLGKLTDVFTNQRKKLKEKQDLIEVRIAMLGAMRNAMFDESYLTQGAFNRICSVEGGQGSQRRDEDILKKISENRNPTTSIPHVISKKTGRAATLQERLISSRENLAKLEAKRVKYANKAKKSPSKALNILQHGAIDCSKYAERSILGSLETLMAIKDFKSKLEACEGDPQKVYSLCKKNNKFLNFFDKHGNLIKPLDRFFEKIDAAIKEAEKIHFKAAELEKCKRQFNLNQETTLELLNAELIETRGATKNYINELREALNLFEPGGKFDGADLLPDEKYNLFMSHLASKRVIEVDDRDGLLFTANPEFDAIVKARCGFDRMKDPDVNKVHQYSEKITMQRLNLSTIEDIETYNHSISDMNDEVLALSIESGFIPTPPGSIRADLSLVALIQGATIK